VNSFSDKVVMRSLVYLFVQKWFAEVKTWPKLANPFKKADFQSLFARSASAVTNSEKKFN